MALSMNVFRNAFVRQETWNAAAIRAALLLASAAIAASAAAADGDNDDDNLTTVFGNTAKNTI